MCLRGPLLRLPTPRGVSSLPLCPPVPEGAVSATVLCRGLAPRSLPEASPVCTARRSWPLTPSSSLTGPPVFLKALVCCQCSALSSARICHRRGPPPVSQSGSQPLCHTTFGTCWLGSPGLGPQPSSPMRGRPPPRLCTHTFPQADRHSPPLTSQSSSWGWDPEAQPDTWGRRAPPSRCSWNPVS